MLAGERERFKRELFRLRGLRFKRLLIIGSEEDILRGNFRSNISPKAVLATLYAFEIRYDLPFQFCATPGIAGRLIERWATWFSRELCKNATSLFEGSQAKSAQLAKAERLNQQSDGTATDISIG
jgi:hypothetical protein